MCSCVMPSRPSGDDRSAFLWMGYWWIAPRRCSGGLVDERLGSECWKSSCGAGSGGGRGGRGGWLLDLLDLPRESSVGFATGATVANFVCLAAARGEVLRRAGWDVEANGLFGAPPITVLIGDDAHTTVFSALQFLGLGHDRVVRIKTDAQGRMDLEDFARGARRIWPGDRGRAGRPGQYRRLRSVQEAHSGCTRCRRVDTRGRGVRTLGAGVSGAAPSRGWNRPGRLYGRRTGTSGCRRPMTAATQSCATRVRTAARRRSRQATCRRGGGRKRSDALCARALAPRPRLCHLGDDQASGPFWHCRNGGTTLPRSACDRRSAGRRPWRRGA